MKFRLELEFEDVDHLKTIAVLAALLNEGNEVFDRSGVLPWDLIDAINNICCNAYLEEEDIEVWVGQSFLPLEAKERWRKTLRVRLNNHIHDTPNES